MTKQFSRLSFEAPMQEDYRARPRALWAGLYLAAQNYPHIFETDAFKSLVDRVDELDAACRTNSELQSKVELIVSQVMQGLSEDSHEDVLTQ